MPRTLYLVLWCALFLMSSRQVISGEWDSRISEVIKQSEAEIQKALRANARNKAKELIRARDKQLTVILSEYESSGERDLPADDALAVIHSYEILFRWEQALQLATVFVEGHPDAEAAYMAIFRSLVNLNRVEEAAELLAKIEDRFPQDSPIQFVHSMLAPKYQIRKEWQLAMRHADVAAHRRIALIRTHPNIADWALTDFRRIAEAAIGMGDKEAGVFLLNQLSEQLDRVLAEIGNEDVSDTTFSQECLARKLRSDIAYWLGGEEAAVPFQQWVRSIITAWSNGTVSEQVARIQATAVLVYLDRHGGILTPKMIDSLRELKAHVDHLLADSPDDKILAELRAMCQRTIESRGGKEPPKPKRSVPVGINSP